jgi:hypothetical protein
MPFQDKIRLKNSAFQQTQKRNAPTRTINYISLNNNRCRETFFCPCETSKITWSTYRKSLGLINFHPGQLILFIYRIRSKYVCGAWT